jgi:hypothetical protein
MLLIYWKSDIKFSIFQILFSIFFGIFAIQFVIRLLLSGSFSRILTLFNKSQNDKNSQHTKFFFQCKERIFLRV